MISNTTLSGWLAFPIEKKEKDGKVYVRNKINVPRNYKDNDNKMIYDCFSFVAFGKNAEFLANYAKKSDHLVIQGRLQSSPYEIIEAVKGEDGDYYGKRKKIYQYEVLVQEVEVHSNRQTNKTNDGEEGMKVDFVKDDVQEVKEEQIETEPSAVSGTEQYLPFEEKSDDSIQEGSINELREWYENEENNSLESSELYE